MRIDFYCSYWLRPNGRVSQARGQRVTVVHCRPRAVQDQSHLSEHGLHERSGHRHYGHSPRWTRTATRLRRRLAKSHGARSRLRRRRPLYAVHNSAAEAYTIIRGPPPSGQWPTRPLVSCAWPAQCQRHGLAALASPVDVVAGRRPSPPTPAQRQRPVPSR